jgi:hypothetical protein
MRTRARARVGTILLLVAVLTLLTALPVLALEPTDSFSGITPGRPLGGGTCGFSGRTGVYGNCPGGGGYNVWSW